MSKLTKSQEQELKHLWESGQPVAWLEKLREYAPEEEKKATGLFARCNREIAQCPKARKGDRRA